MSGAPPPPLTLALRRRRSSSSCQHPREIGRRRVMPLAARGARVSPSAESGPHANTIAAAMVTAIRALILRLVAGGLLDPSTPSSTSRLWLPTSPSPTKIGALPRKAPTSTRLAGPPPPESPIATSRNSPPTRVRWRLGGMALPYPEGGICPRTETDSFFL